MAISIEHDRALTRIALAAEPSATTPDLADVGNAHSAGGRSAMETTGSSANADGDLQTHSDRPADDGVPVLPALLTAAVSGAFAELQGPQGLGADRYGFVLSGLPDASAVTDFCHGLDLTQMIADMRAGRGGNALSDGAAMEPGAPTQTCAQAHEALAITGLDRIQRPGLAYINGGATGSGIALAQSATHRVAGPAFHVAVPSCQLGLIPSGGTLRTLARLEPDRADRHQPFRFFADARLGIPDRPAPRSAVGLFLALTGFGLTQADGLELGLVDFAMGPDAVAAVCERLAVCEPIEAAIAGADHATLARLEAQGHGAAALLDGAEPSIDPRLAGIAPLHPGAFKGQTLADYADVIGFAFAPPTPADIITRLDDLASGGEAARSLHSGARAGAQRPTAVDIADWASATAERLRMASPLAVALTQAAYRAVPTGFNATPFNFELALGYWSASQPDAHAGLDAFSRDIVHGSGAAKTGPAPVHWPSAAWDANALAASVKAAIAYAHRYAAGAPGVPVLTFASPLTSRD